MGASAAAQPPKGESLQARFWNHAQALAQKAGLGVAPGCEGKLRNFIAGGVGRLQSEGVLEDQERISEAEENLIAFVNAMIDEAKRQSMPDLHEFTFDAALTALCPIWPFC